MQIFDQLGARVREVRKSQGRSNAYVVGKLGKTPSWLSAREHGTTEITAVELKSIAEVLDVPIDSFFV